MAENLNEELDKIKRLINFSISDNSHDKLSEENIRKAINEQEVVEGEDCVTISHVGRFPVSDIAGSGAFKTFMDKIDATVKGNPKLADKIQKGVVYVTDFSLIGGASNFWEKFSVTPERKNDRKSNYSGEPYQKDHKTPEFKKNKALAVSRAKGLADELNGKKGLKGIHVQFDEGVLEHAKDNAQGYIIDTGGINDKPNESSWTINGVTYQPGQVVEVSMTICYEPRKGSDIEITGKTVVVITKEQTKILYECFNDGTIEVIYDGKGHWCWNAVYEIYANGYKLKRKIENGKLVDYASLNNKNRDKDPYDNAIIIKSQGDTKSPKAGRGAKYKHKTKGRNKKIPKGRKNIFHLEIDGINKEFFNADIVGKHNGQLVISAKCIEAGHGKWKSGNTDCHRGVGKIKMMLPSMKKDEVVPNAKTPDMFGEEKILATFPACENIIKRVATEDPKIIQKIKTWFKKNKGKKEVIKKEVTNL